MVVLLGMPASQNAPLLALGLPLVAAGFGVLPFARGEVLRPRLRAMGLLKDNCLACHNPEKKKGKLILTTREGALAGGENGAVIVPGQPAASRLLAVLSPDSARSNST